jgi:hypothetical protein
MEIWGTSSADMFTKELENTQWDNYEQTLKTKE